MQLPSQLPIASALDVDSFVDGQANEIQRFLHACSVMKK